VEILPDSLVYKTLQDQKTAPENLFFISIPKLIITGVKTPKALLNREISGHIMKIENAHIEIRLSKGKKEEQPYFREFMNNDMYRQLLGNLKSIRADSVILENASLSILDKESKTIRCKAGGLSFRFSGIAIDSLNQNDSSRILFSKDLAIHCTDLVLPFGGKAYNLEISGIDFNSRTESFHTGRIKLKPRLSETDFAKSHKYSIDRFDFTIGSLDIRHISRPAFLRQELVADTFQINEASFRTFRDLSYPYDSVDRTHGYPQEAIMLLPIQVYIKKLLVKDSYIEYKEKNDKSDSSGKVAFFHVQAGFDNVTNMPPLISQNNLMRLNFKASFLDESPFSANIRMRLNNREGVFDMDAELGEMNATSLNPLLKPIALAELDAL
jgi:hypothetical protein